jgi:hypothetical protein
MTPSGPSAVTRIVGSPLVHGPTLPLSASSGLRHTDTIRRIPLVPASRVGFDQILYVVPEHLADALGIPQIPVPNRCVADTGCTAQAPGNYSEFGHGPPEGKEFPLRKGAQTSEMGSN